MVSESELRAAIDRAEPALANDAREILLVPPRKRVYDLNHRVLKTIAQIRSRTNLTHVPNWQGEIASEFSRPAQPTPILPTVFRFSPAASERADPSSDTAQSGARPAASTSSNAGVFVLVCLILAGAAAVSASRALKAPKPQPDRSTPLDPDTARALPPKFEPPEVPLPASGSVTRFSKRRAVAPLKLYADFGTHHLVKLVRVPSLEQELTIFVRSGGETEVKVPLGTYEIRYASGDRWHGDTHLFGPATFYSKAEKEFRFQSTEEHISGFTIKLRKAADGNLRTSSLTAVEF